MLEKITPICMLRESHISQNFSLPYATQNSNWIPNKWSVNPVKYSVTRDSADIAGNSVEKIMVNLAMTAWEAELGIKLIYVKSDQKPDIDIQWVTSAEDSFFTSPSILAYAGYPQTRYQGILRMNDDVIWSPDGRPITSEIYTKLTGKPVENTQNTFKTYNANQTLGHEIGHLLGAVHIEDCPLCLMYPYYNGTITPTTRDLEQLIPKYGRRNLSSEQKMRLRQAVENRRKTWDGKWKFSI
jgi:hypothetical protein